MTTTKMTFSLWGLAILILWTIAVVTLLLTVRLQHLMAGGSHADFDIQDEKSLLWRLFRAQANLVENLLLYLGVVFLLTIRGVSGTVVDGLVVLYILCRIVHSVVHIAGLNSMYRVLSLVIQFICLVLLMALAVFAPMFMHSNIANLLQINST